MRKILLFVFILGTTFSLLAQQSYQLKTGLKQNIKPEEPLIGIEPVKKRVKFRF
jgi:hypothetical protein